MAKKNWIKGAIKHPGALHKSLGIKGKIPVSVLKEHDKGNSTLAKRARLAETLRKLRH